MVLPLEYEFFGTYGDKVFFLEYFFAHPFAVYIHLFSAFGLLDHIIVSRPCDLDSYSGSEDAPDPDIGIAVDVTRSGDTPKSIKMDVSLGQGPAIKVRDSGMLSDPRVVDWMVSTAEKSKIPYQMEVLEAGTTDARAIQLTRAGVPAGCISIPCRYVHAPSEMVDFKDVQNAVHLLLALIKQEVTLE